jgi:hypothetical protein
MDTTGNSHGQDDAEGSERRPRRPPPEPTDGARGTEEDDDESGCKGQPETCGFFEGGR